MTLATPQISEERVKPFRLVKYFTFTSIIVLFLGTIILSILNTHWARTMQRQKSEEYALLMLENLNHQIFLRFIIPVAFEYGRVQLRNKAQFELMDKVVIAAVEADSHLGLPTDVDAILLIEVDGDPESLNVQVGKIEAIPEDIRRKYLTCGRG